MRTRFLVVVAVLALAAACGGGSVSPGALSPAASPSPQPATAQAPTPAPDTAAPRRVTFAPGQTVVALAEAGIFFLDPKTGATEGWVVPDAGPGALAFTVGGMSASGNSVLYSCQEYQAIAPARPCAGSGSVTWYLLDTSTGARARLDRFQGSFISISPDGRTIIGNTAQGVAMAATASPDAVRLIDQGRGARGVASAAYWSPGSDRVVLVLDLATPRPPTPTPVRSLLLDGAGRIVRDLGTVWDLAWSPDGSRFAEEHGAGSYDLNHTLTMFDRDGGVLWTHRPVYSRGGNPQWSPDSRSLAFQALTPRYSISEIRLDVLDAASGATRFRIPGAFACSGPVWTADGSRLVVDGPGPGGSVVADPATRTFRTLSAYVTPDATNPNLGITWGGDFGLVDLNTGRRALLSHTTLDPSWDSAHGLPLFAGGRIVYTPHHGAHGGCGESIGPGPAPKLAFQYPPFAGG